MVHVRRTTTNLRDDILRMVCQSINHQEIPIFSGSKAEGLRFKSSDEDWMFVSTDIKVIPSESYTTLYDIHNVILLFMENEMTKPGFTLLRLKEESRYRSVKLDRSSTVIPMLDRCYVSSKKWKDINVTGMTHGHSVFLHGPCTSFELCDKEIDHAHCLKCDVWPANALPSIKRLYKSSWPSTDILHNIVTDGVLFVPIGAKRSVFEDEEWRMSFSLAEKRLIHSMNHTQFLCYGLLKLFLKEAIDANEDVKGLLCSYFLKTALFWEITASPQNWNPLSLLSCFWKCFCRLLQWVRSSYCPNYFIPENNMFHGKIEGTNRDKLLQHLNTLYYEGYRSLLRCTSLNIQTSNTPTLLADVLNGAKLVIPCCRTCVVFTIIEEVLHSGPLYSVCFLHDTVRALCLHLHRVTQTTSSSLEWFLTKRWLYEALTDFCVTQSSQTFTPNIYNKLSYKHQSQRIRIFNRCRLGSACHRLHQATEYHNMGKYSQSLTLAQRAEKAIFSKDSMGKGAINHNKCIEINEDFPIDTMLRKCYLHIMCCPKIPEFYIETFFGRGRSMEYSFPPAVYALLLQYLYYDKQGHLQKRDEFLYKISHLIQHADGHHINKHNDLYTSRQVLGICQQMSGDNRAAFHSYRMALHHNFYSHRAATYFRMGAILAKYFLAQRQLL